MVTVDSAIESKLLHDLCVRCYPPCRHVRESPANRRKRVRICEEINRLEQPFEIAGIYEHYRRLTALLHNDRPLGIAHRAIGQFRGAVVKLRSGNGMGHLGNPSEKRQSTAQFDRQIIRTARPKFYRVITTFHEPQ
jgi:hypothetical protein